MPEKDASQSRRRRRERRMLVCLECHRRKLKCDKKRPCNRCVASDTPLKCTYVKLGDVASPKHILRETQQAWPEGRVRDPNVVSIGDPEPSSNGTVRSTPLLPLAPRQKYPAPDLHNQGDSQAPVTAVAALLESFHREEPEHPAGSDPLPQAESPSARPASAKSRHGRSGVQFLFPKFSHISALTSQTGLALPSGEFTTFREFRTQLFQRRELFLEDSQGPQTSIFDEFPARETTDMLVDRYFATFGSVFNFLNQPTFRAQTQTFWERPESVSISNCIQILLVVAIGNATIDSTSGRLPHAKIVSWWHLVMTWQSVALRSSPRDLHTLQACCLIDIMRDAYSFDAPASWPSSGLLVRNAMMAGLHRDPLYTDQLLSKEETHLRQELWYTIMELDLQNSMGQAMPPAVTSDDWDMPLPSEDNNSDSVGGVYSKTVSPRSILVSTLSVRTRIAQFLNSIKCSTSYAEAAKLHEELNRLAHPFLSPSPSQGNECDLSFANDLPAIICRRSLLALHIPFAVLRSPLYAYSYNICLSTALSLLERIDPRANQNEHLQHDGIVILMRTSGSIFRTVALQALLFLCLQMEASLRDYQPWTLATELRDRFIAIAERYLLIAEQRLTTQDFVGKAFILPAMALAHAKLSNSGMSAEDIASCDRVLAKELAATCFSLFRSRPDIPSF